MPVTLCPPAEQFIGERGTDHACNANHGNFHFGSPRGTGLSSRSYYFGKHSLVELSKADTAGFSVRGSLNRTDFGMKTFVPYIWRQG